jgi:hypothetical protein
MLEALADGGVGAVEKTAGKSFSKGVVPAMTPSSSTVAPEGVLVILRDSAGEGWAHKNRSRATGRRRRSSMKGLSLVY